MPDIILRPKRQLFDLNEDKTTFDIEVNVTCKKPTDVFQAVIITQTELDNGNVTYKDFTGGMKARLTNNKNVYQNHFLCMKSDQNTNVNLDIIRKEAPPLPPQENLLQPPQQQLPIRPKTPPPSLFNFKTVIIILLVVGIGVGLYFLWQPGSTGAPALKDTAKAAAPVASTPNVSSLTEQVNTLIKSTPKVASPNLMTRLNKLVE